MRWLLALAFVTLGLISTTSGQKTKPTSAAANVQTAILKLEDDNNRARIAGDAALLKSLYADDFVGIDGGGGDTDKAQIVSFYTEDGPIMALHSTSNVKVRILQNAVVVTALLKYQYNEKYENRNVRWLRYTRIYEKRATGWKVVAEHFTITTDPDSKKN